MQLVSSFLLTSLLLGNGLAAPAAYDGDLAARDVAEATDQLPGHFRVEMVPRTGADAEKTAAGVEVSAFEQDWERPGVFARGVDAAEEAEAAEAAEQEPPAEGDVQKRGLEAAEVTEAAEEEAAAEEAQSPVVEKRAVELAENAELEDVATGEEAEGEGGAVEKRGDKGHGHGGNSHGVDHHTNNHPPPRPKSRKQAVPQVHIANDRKAASVPPKKLPKPVQASKPTGNRRYDLDKTNKIAKAHRNEDGRILKTAIAANRKDAKLYPHDAKADHRANEQWRSFLKKDRKNDMNSIAAGKKRIEDYDRKHPAGHTNQHHTNTYNDHHTTNNHGNGHGHH